MATIPIYILWQPNYKVTLQCFAKCSLTILRTLSILIDKFPLFLAGSEGPKYEHYYFSPNFNTFCL